MWDGTVPPDSRANQVDFELLPDGCSGQICKTLKENIMLGLKIASMDWCDRCRKMFSVHTEHPEAYWL